MKKFKKSKKREFKDTTSKKKRSKGVLWAWIIILVMVLSVIGFVSVDLVPTGTTYNDFEFTAIERGWIGEIGEKQMLFYYHPSELEFIETDKDAINKLKNSKMIYFTSDPDDKAKEIIGKIEFELIEELKNNNQYFVYAFTKENEFNKTIIDCNNATANVPILKLESSNETSIKYENNCIIARSSSDFNFLSIRDRIFYGVFGVME